ncbi:hypothetical protein [Aliagarivorans marinus]|uniref:hypothetical protein n=1 Tax=Aliagarivorans marinus TaxID=561965 RepID=UPI0004293E4F|nr:hypothetical protein [Aliagarivorans marinus]
MREHGWYELEQHTQVIVVRFFSDWNKRTSEHMCRDFLEIASTMADKPWACLIDLSQWGLGGPDVWEPIVEANRWCAANNQRLEAVVCSQSIQKHILEGLQEELPDTESAFFENEADARQWLSDKGFPLG